METTQPGVILDPRTQEAKNLDYRSEELASIAPIDWVEKTPDEFRKFPIRNQDGSSSCVAQSGAKVLGIENVLEENIFMFFSAKDIYCRRTNEGGGMWLQEAMSLMSKEGTTTEASLPSQDMNEGEINTPYTLNEVDFTIKKKYRAGGYVTLQKDINAVADIVVNQGKGVMILFYFTYEEWTNEPKVINAGLPIVGENTVRHCVTVVDACLWNGEKALVIDDSWGPYHGTGGQRVITKSFFNERCFGAGYVLDLSNIPPSFVFTKTLRLGSRGLEVKMLQEKLGITADGIFGKNTFNAVVTFQKKHNLVPDGIVGFYTRKKLNGI